MKLYLKCLRVADFDNVLFPLLFFFFVVVLLRNKSGTLLQRIGVMKQITGESVMEQNLLHVPPFSCLA